MTGTNSPRLFLAAMAIGGLLTLATLAQAEVLVFEDDDPGDFTGTRVDISGDLIIVGGCCGGAEGEGWAQTYVYTNTSGPWQWEYQATLASSDPTLNATSWFGHGVGIDGSTVVAGAPGNNTVYTFDYNESAGTWSENTSGRLQYVGASEFGYDTRRDGDYVIVGAPASKTAYIFGGSVDDENLPASGTRTDFGTSVDLSGTLAVVGDPGANTAHFYHYQYDEPTEEWVWAEEGAFSCGSSGDRFGISVAIDGDYAIVGADKTVSGGKDNAGSATIYHREYDGNSATYTWEAQATLAPSELTTDDRFGTSVALSGDTAVVGAIKQGPSGQRTGSVYVFERIDELWGLTGKLRPDDGQSGEEFGHAVAIDEDWIVVGAWCKDAYTGAAYVFETPVFTPIPGDANLDNRVDEADAAILADHWGTTSDATWTLGDFNGDQAVNAADASILAANWHVGVTEACASVPEPGQLTLLAGLLLLLPARRRR